MLIQKQSRGISKSANGGEQIVSSKTSAESVESHSRGDGTRWMYSRRAATTNMCKYPICSILTDAIYVFLRVVVMHRYCWVGLR